MTPDFAGDSCSSWIGIAVFEAAGPELTHRAAVWKTMMLWQSGEEN